MKSLSNVFSDSQCCAASSAVSNRTSTLVSIATTPLSPQVLIEGSLDPYVRLRLDLTFQHAGHVRQRAAHKGRLWPQQNAVASVNDQEFSTRFPAMCASECLRYDHLAFAGQSSSCHWRAWRKTKVRRALHGVRPIQAERGAGLGATSPHRRRGPGTSRAQLHRRRSWWLLRYCLPDTTTSMRCGPPAAMAARTAAASSAGSSMRSPGTPIPRASATKSRLGDRSMCG